MGKAIVKKNKGKIIDSTLKKAIEIYKEKGFYVPSFENLSRIGHLKWLYCYFTNGFNGRQAYKDAGYTAGVNIDKCVYILKNRLATQLAELLETTVFLENDLEVDLFKMSEADMADYEKFLDGEMTLVQLRASGVDTKHIKSLIKGVDRDGKPYGKIELPDQAGIKAKLLKIKRSAQDEVNRQINIKEQTINIITNTPTYHEREKHSKKIKKLEVIDVESENKEKK